jgi:hypothetical protein
MTEDELVSHIAMADYDSFATRFAVAVVESGLDADDLKEPLLGIDDLAAASGTDASFSDDAQDAELDKYPVLFPNENDRGVPQDNKCGFRTYSRALADLFDINIIGRLPGITSIGAIPE